MIDTQIPEAIKDQARFKWLFFTSEGREFLGGSHWEEKLCKQLPQEEWENPLSETDQAWLLRNLRQFIDKSLECPDMIVSG